MLKRFNTQKIIYILKKSGIKKYYIPVIVVSLLSSFSELFLAYSTSSLFTEKFNSPFLLFFKSFFLFRNLSSEYILIIFTIGAVFLNFINRLIWLAYINYAWFRLSTTLNKKVCENLINQDFNLFKSKKTGELSNILNSQSTSISGDFLYPMVAFLQPLASIIFVLGYGLIVETKITSTILITVGSVYLSILFLSRRYFTKFSKIIQNSQQEIQSFSNSGLNSIKEIKASQRESEFLEKYTYYDSHYRKSQGIGRFAQLSPKTIIETSGLLIILLIILINYKSGNGFVISASEIVLLAIIFKSILTNVQAIYTILAQIGLTTAAVNQVYNLLTNSKAIKSNKISTNILNPEIIYKSGNNFSLVIKAEKIKLSNNDFFKTNNSIFSNGRIIGIVGPSGRGKTTYMDFLSGLYTNLKIKNIENSHIFYLTQFTYINDITINSYLEITTNNKKRVKKYNYYKLFQRLKLVDTEQDFNEMLNTRVSYSASKLSGGQLKRLALIKAVCSGARILLLDEFTSGLNKELELEALKIIKEFVNQQNLVVLISHNETVNSFCDNLIDISDLTKYYRNQKDSLLSQNTIK
tara:strand:+ start:17406 stop:19145 length:1740 start_codon:yes stop_codon:yes gene_type:complete